MLGAAPKCPIDLFYQKSGAGLNLRALKIPQLQTGMRFWYKFEPDARRLHQQGQFMALRARLLAFYLPQFHPIPENDEWWGKGFTEWTNTAKAKPLFHGHYQPHVPADLGFYDLRVPETRQAQANMARAHGIEGFCYYHYWFGGRRILERPFREVLKSGEPDFPFCICWANQTWTGVWHGEPNRILIEQTYPGDDDHRAHFQSLLPAFQDPRYVTVDGEPVFVIFRPFQLPDARRATDLWRELAVKAGLKGLHLVGVTDGQLLKPEVLGFDALTTQTLVTLGPSKRHPLKWAAHKYRQIVGLPRVYNYAEILDQLVPLETRDQYPSLIHAWDNTPRSGANGIVLRGSTPELFRKMLRRALQLRADVPLEKNILFLKSWNEWAEGNHLEPDLRFGRAYLDVIKEVVAP
jgi:lipopolysaccharide biosynthesis protein